MPIDHEPLQAFGSEHQLFKIYEIDQLNPAQDGRPAASFTVIRFVTRQFAPMFRRRGVVLDVIAVVKEQPVVEPTVMTHGSAGMLEVALQITKGQAEGGSWQIDDGKEARHADDERYPKSEQQTTFDKELAASKHAAVSVGMMRKVSFTPESLWDAEEQCEPGGEQIV